MRLVVVGTSGSGKSTFAKALAGAAGYPHIELDALYWDKDWTPKPSARFAELVAAATDGDRWVADGNYSAVRHVVWPLATHVIWLNYGRATVFARVLRRTLKRTLTQEALWHGNRESLRRAFFSRESILLWTLSTYAMNRVKYKALRTEGAYPHLQWLEFTRPAAAEAFLREQSADAGAHQAGSRTSRH